MTEELVFLNARIPLSLKIEIKKLAIDNEIPVQTLCKELFELGIPEFKKKQKQKK